MSGRKRLRKMQLGREATAGTAVAATDIWRGIGTLEDQHETVFVDEDIGYLSPVDNAYKPKLGAQINFDAIEATYEQILHLFEAGIKTATPAQDAAGTGYLYTYTLPTTSSNTIKTYTIEVGDDVDVDEAEYCFLENIKLSGKWGEALKMSGTWKGRQVSDSSFTGALTVPSINVIQVAHAKLYIDAIGGSLGSTEKASTLLDLSWNYKTGIVAQGAATGAKYFSHIEYGSPELTLDITFLHNALGLAEKEKWQAGTPSLIRIEFTHDVALATPDVYTYPTMFLDMAGQWEKFDTLGEEDGINTVKGTFRAGYNATAASFAECFVVAEQATIP